MARTLADGGAEVVVFEQNRRPFGKIEDGLPRWHSALRTKEYERIVDKLDHPNVHFVPLTRVGRDFAFEDVANGFSAVVLACGAWRDRPLPVDDADRYVGKGLLYQNAFIVAFNHQDDPTYEGPPPDIADGAIVIGGGLASIDVVKVLMLETTRRALAERGVEVDIEQLEKTGIPRTLEMHDLEWEDLGLKGATLFYRRRPEDMPLVEMPEGADDARREKIERTRRRALEKAMSKFGFHLEPLARPESLIVENGHVVGVKFRRMTMDGGKLTATDETFERRGSRVISSIGSIPDPIPGIDMKGELFAFEDWSLGRLARYPHVFSAGNVVTGKGNIVASRKHSAGVAQQLVESFLGLDEDEDRKDEAGMLDAMEKGARSEAERVASSVSELPGIDPERREETLRKVAGRQKEVGYDGDIRAWVRDPVTPQPA
jgi:NADPH-dependent glutamate synthase beta subunit-like oxidoreductase